jgi:hypothetical protein
MMQGYWDPAVVAELIMELALVAGVQHGTFSCPNPADGDTQLRLVIG